MRKEKEEKTRLTKKQINQSTKLTEKELQSAKGTVLKWSRIPVIEKFKKFIENNFGEPDQNLVAEGNSYVNLNKCGIGFHGDTERHVVIAIRFGKSFPTHYQWYYKTNPVASIKSWRYLYNV